MVEQFTQHTYKALAVRQVTFYSSHSCTEDVQLDQYTAIMSCLPNLQCFSIQQQTWRTPQARVVPFQGLSAVNKVTQLSFTGVNFPSPMHFLALVNAFPNLRKLSMDIIFWASDSSQSYDVMYPPFRPPSLQHLSARQALASITPHLLTRDTVQKLESVALEAAVMQSWWSIFENDVVYDNLRKITVVDLMFYRAISLPTLPKTPNLKTFALTGILIRTRNNRELDHVRYIVHNLQIVDSNSVEELFFEFYGVQEADLPLFSSAVWLPCLQQSKFDHLQRIVYTFVGRSLKGLEGEITARVMDAHESFEKRALIEIAVEDISV
ncbi:hypothetical protein BDW22DRAFT_1351122 [Trametopsis cervina]|nr:hypothetical protein BDW22DRAFT_1351122 [Trametopsis cervina]